MYGTRRKRTKKEKAHHFALFESVFGSEETQKKVRDASMAVCGVGLDALVACRFLVIDMVVASILMSLGMMMLSPMLIALPFKLLLFVLVDGWTMTVGSLVGTFS